MSLVPLAIVPFVHPLLLAGLGLVALPVVIHWLSRRRYIRADWGATRFLLMAEKQNRRRVKFEQWLLLALRMLAVALLALLLARPFTERGAWAALLGDRSATRRVLLLDDSASAGFLNGPRDDFERLKEAAGRLLSVLTSGGSDAGLVSLRRTTAPDPPVFENERLTSANLPALLEKLRALRATVLPGQAGRALERVLQPAAAESAPIELYVFSDFQRSEWIGDGPAEQSPLQTARRNRSGLSRAVLVDANAGERENIALTALRAVRGRAVVNQPFVVEVTARNFGDVARPAVRAQFELEGVPGSSIELGTLAPRSAQTVRSEVVFGAEGVQELALRLERNDGLVGDDVRRAAIAVSSVLRVVVLLGPQSGPAAADAAYFIRSALCPPGPIASGIEVESADASEADVLDLSRADCVLLCDAGSMRDAAVAALESFVRRGGGLAIFAGPQLESVESLPAAWRAGGGLWPVRLTGVVERDPGAGVGLLRDVDHPVTPMLSDAAAGPSEYVRFWKYVQIGGFEPEVTSPTPPATRAAEAELAASRPAPPVVLAHFADEAGSPAWVERRFGCGRVLFFASSLTPQWNNWARAVDGSFVVTLLELVQSLAAGDDRASEFVAGDDLRIPVDLTSHEANGLFYSPLYPDEPAVEIRGRETGTGTAELIGPQAVHLGRHEVELLRRDGTRERRVVPVNAAAAESDLAVASEAQLRAALAGTPHTYVRVDEAFLSGGRPPRQELWPALLLVLVGVLMLEQTAAWHFGRARPAARRAAIASEGFAQNRR